MNRPIRNHGKRGTLAVARERVYRVLAVRGEVSVSEIAREAGVSRRYVYRILGELSSRGIVALHPGKAVLVDRKALVLTWGFMKRPILRKYSVVAYFYPREICDIVLFSGTAALWILGRVLYPTMGTMYVHPEKTGELMEKRNPKGYPLRIIIDEHIFKYKPVKIRGNFKLPFPEQFAADAIAEGLYGTEALEYIR